MFRGGDYVDDPSFHDIAGKPGYNYMDVADINGEDKYGNNLNSPTHIKFKYKREMLNMAATGESVIGSPKKSLRGSGAQNPPAGQRLRPDTGKRFLKEILQQNPEYISYKDTVSNDRIFNTVDITGTQKINQYG